MAEAPTILAGTLRGVAGAMAMSGMRRVTTRVGALSRTPPERVYDAAVEPVAPGAPPRRRMIVQELAHWGYGAIGGAIYALLPAPLRRSRAAGPAFGLAAWAAFEVVIAPALGPAGGRPRPARERAALIADHILYGLVVGARSPG
jgi:hypothetical protein